MKKWLQRIRGGIGMGLIWAEAWALLGALAGLITGVVLGLPLGTVVANYALLLGGLGFVGGTVFSTVLSIADGGRRFDQLSLPRFVSWGALGGLMLGGLAVTAGTLGAGSPILGAVLASVSTLLGAGSAAATLAIARAADQPALLEEGEEVGRAGLAAEEAH